MHTNEPVARASRPCVPIKKKTGFVCGEEIRTRRRESEKEDAKKKGNLLLERKLQGGMRSENLHPIRRSSSRLPSRFRAFAVVFLPPRSWEK
jgi:hypothetical protein